VTFPFWYSFQAAITVPSRIRVVASAMLIGMTDVAAENLSRSLKHHIMI
jgi:hypothetical protein